MPGSPNITINHSLACSGGFGVVSGTWTSGDEQEVTLSLIEIGDDTNPGSTTPLAPVTGTGSAFEFPPVVDGLYYIEAIGSISGSTTTDSFTIDCSVDPDPDPEPTPETPGTATPPAAKYMAVGGVLPNPIEYTFAFQVNDAAAVPKTGHYVTVNIYREGELAPFASTRQRIRNGAAKVDVSRFVKALVSPSPGFDSSLTVTTDSNAMAGFTIGFVEAWGAVTMDEVKENTVKYAVNAALQSLDGNYVEHVILAS